MPYSHKTRKSNALFDGSDIFLRHVAIPPVGQALLTIAASRSHSDTPHSVGLLWTWDQPQSKHLHDNTQHSQEPDIHASDGIRTHSLGKRAAAGPRLKPRGHWNRINEFHNLYLSQSIIRQPNQDGQDGWVV